jgi:CheY-like chemotaxis protein
MANPLNILLIDDDEDTQNIFRMVTEHHQHHLLVAGDGDEAVDILQDNRPDIVVIDLVLPGQDGYQVFNRIVDTQLASDSAFVAITAYYTSDTPNRVKTHGFNGFLPKPLWSAELMQSLASIFEGK